MKRRASGKKMGAAGVAAAVVLAVAVGVGLGAGRAWQGGAAAPPAGGQGGGVLAVTEIERLGFLEGVWRGELNGEFVEEMWSAPKGNNIIGAFRWLKPDGTARMMEILSIVREEDAVRLRLIHFTAALSQKEEKDRPMTMVLSGVGVTEEGVQRVEFAAEKDAGDLKSLVYLVEEEAAEGGGERVVLTIEVRFVSAERRPLVFRLVRG